MDASSLIPQSNHGTMVESSEDEDHSLGSLSSFSEDDQDSSSLDFMDDATSSSSSSSSSSLDDKEPAVFQMSSLMTHLPIKRGLSKHYQGKSQSFTSLSNLKCLEDLVKPERFPCRKRLKSSKSYGNGLDSQKALSPKECSRAITKKNSKRHGLFGNKPPIHPQRTGTLFCLKGM
ncbi:hypothetical protein J5N97_023723 [Dioscorea zingiberensis]|uniref:Oxidative stress 3 n=1 Tax=Dioscorea zingiberensis TaxID=325984 RepID=A0A9D5C530_9LILI|nr:hypothetical protein J5N97_023723 [Dioscorea zingiberensis]